MVTFALQLHASSQMLCLILCTFSVVDAVTLGFHKKLSIAENILGYTGMNPVPYCHIGLPSYFLVLLAFIIFRSLKLTEPAISNFIGKKLVEFVHTNDVSQFQKHMETGK